MNTGVVAGGRRSVSRVSGDPRGTVARRHVAGSPKLVVLGGAVLGAFGLVLAGQGDLVHSRGQALSAFAWSSYPRYFGAPSRLRNGANGVAAGGGFAR